MARRGEHVASDVEKYLHWKEVLKQQWFMTKFCFKTAPGFMIFHLFEAVKLQVSIFFEFTWAINYIMNVAEAGGDFRKILWCMGILMAAIAVSTVTFAIYMHYVVPKAKPVLYQAFRMMVYEKAKELDLACYDDRDFYEQFILATQEAEQCVERYLSAIEFASGRAVKLILSLWYAFYINPIVLLLVVIILPFDLFLVRKENEVTVTGRMERLTHEQKREYDNRIFYLADYAKDLRLNPRMKQKCRADYKESNDEICKIHRKYGKKLFKYGVIRDVFLCEIILEGMTWTILLYQVLVLHTLSCADMITSRTCMYNFNYASRTLVDTWRLVCENSVYVSRIRKLMEMESSIVSGNVSQKLDETGDISVEHLEFAYPSGKQVLKDINLHVKAGQKVALVGYNGSGKSTLVKLLLRLYDPTSGRICFAGEDIRDYDVKEYRKSIGSVFQDFKIYAATLKENVLMDVSDGSKDENYLVENALFNAHFTLEDNRLVYQTQTPLTTEFEKDGVNLSGGESQKVAIARTLYRKQNLIIMDEPSAALDPLAEYHLNQELNEIAKDKTVIFISHRLSTTRDADCIYMMEDGRIIEHGTHEQLLAKDGKYADMWKVQAGLYMG